MPTVGEALQLALAQAGVRHTFGIPGVHTIELFRGIGDCDLELVVPRHEQGAGFMADGYARVSGRPGVCWLITGLCVTNAITPVAQAFHDSVPHDLLGRPCPPLPALAGAANLGEVRPPATDLDAAAELLARAARPIIVLGGGAVAEAAWLAEALDPPWP